MKKIIILSAMACMHIANAQVGVDTETPKATLDVMASAADTTKPDGIIAPRLTGVELKAKDALYGQDQNGTIIFATTALDPNAAAGDANATTSKTELVTEVGYFYYDHADGEKWKPFYKEPWNVRATDTKATTIDQDIYHLGNVTAGSKFFSNAVLTSYLDTDVNPASYGQQIWILDKDNTVANGFNLVFSSSSTPQSSNNTDEIAVMSVGMTDASTVARSPLVADFSYSGNRPVVKPGTTVNGVSSSITLGSGISGDYTVQDVNSLSSSISLTGFGSGETNITKNVKAFTSSVSTNTNSILNMGQDTNGSPGIVTAGEFINYLTAKSGGQVNAAKMFGLTSLLNFYINSADSGTNITVDEAAALHVLNKFEVLNSSSTYNIMDVYGVHVDKEIQSSVGNITIDNIYGVYIEPYLFGINSTIDDNSYNLYSAGPTTQNVIEGKLGIGTSDPASTRVHIIKDASDITPVIVEGLPVFDDNSAASSLPNGALYRTSTGVLMVKY